MNMRFFGIKFIVYAVITFSVINLDMRGIFGSGFWHNVAFFAFIILFVYFLFIRGVKEGIVNISSL